MNQPSPLSLPPDDSTQHIQVAPAPEIASITITFAPDGRFSVLSNTSPQIGVWMLEVAKKFILDQSGKQQQQQQQGDGEKPKPNLWTPGAVSESADRALRQQRG